MNSRVPASLDRSDHETDRGLNTVHDRSRAAALLVHPLRLKILAALLQPDSASGVARRMHLPRQTVNYHVRELARAHFLARAGRRRRRRLFEQYYVATAHAYVLSPDLLGTLAPNHARLQDRFSASYLLAVASTIQSELGGVAESAEREGKRLATFSLNSEIRFTSAEQRARFTKEFQRAVSEIVARYTSPYLPAEGTAGDGRPFRLVAGCYPIPEVQKQIQTEVQRDLQKEVQKDKSRNEIVSRPALTEM
jgi:DNA-binding transcriptional ArsR family regulator